ncbi:hypothetical protein JCM5350_007351 [Sporobolomyces pararoseus]
MILSTSRRTLTHTCSRRQFSSTRLVGISSSQHLSFPRSRPSHSTTPTPPESDESELGVPDDIVSYKLQSQFLSVSLFSSLPLLTSSQPTTAIPFQLSPEKALDISYTAAASTFGVSIVLSHLLSRFFKKWFNYSPAVFDSGIVKKAFKMVLLPVWKIDLVMRGKALLQDTELDLNISALDSSLPGFRLSPLDELPLSAPFSPSLSIPFSPSSHLTQYSTPVTLLPFTRHPLSLLSKISSLPRTLESKDGIGLNPSQFKEILFANYPCLIPIYLGEFELSNDPEGKRVTTVQFGTSESPAFSVYPQFLTPPQWLPQSDSISLSITGRPSQPNYSQSSPEETTSSTSSPSSSSLLKQLEPRLTELMSKLQDKRREQGSLITDEIEEGIELRELLEKNDRVMGYSEWIEQNQEFVQATTKLENVEAMLEQVENMPENVKSLLISSSSLPKFQDRESLLKDVSQQVEKARGEVKKLKPDWIEIARKSE